MHYNVADTQIAIFKAVTHLITRSILLTAVFGDHYAEVIMCCFISHTVVTLPNSVSIKGRGLFY